MKAIACAVLPAVLTLSLAACVSDGAPRAAAPATSASPADPARDLLAAGYRRTTIEGQEYFCRKERVTGTRARTQDVCLTQAELDRRQQDGDHFLKRAQDQGAMQPPSALPAAGSDL